MPVCGVRVVDANTKEVTEYYARIIFVNAAAVNTNLILLNSKSGRFPNGLGNDSGILGKYFAFHNYRAHISATYEGYMDRTTAGGRPTSAYIPRFRNVHKQALAKKDPGPWRVGSHMMGETIPKETNQVSLDSNKKDAWGVPLVNFSVAYDDKMIRW